MKRLVVLCLFVLLVLGMAMPTFAQVATGELGALARWMPSKTPLYFGFRTDDDYLATLDAVGQRLNAAIPDADIPPLVASLDGAIRDSGLFGNDADFQSAIRSWLGATGAVAILSLEDVITERSDTPPVLFALDVTNRAAAEDFWAVLETTENYVRSTDGDFTVFSPSRRRDDEPIVAVGDDVVFIAAENAELPSEVPNDNLAQSEVFSASLALLPEPAYNIVAFLNVGDVLQLTLNNAQMSDADMAMIPGPLLQMLQNYPPMAFGATTLDERSFAIDFAVPLAEMESGMAAMGLSVTPNAPLNPDFVERIPAGTPLVAQGSDLRAVYNQSLQAMRIQMEMLAGMEDESGMTPEEMEAQVERTLEQIRFFVQGATGLDLDTELMPALTEDYALYLGLSTSLADATSLMDVLGSNPINFGLLFSVNDPAVTSALIENLTDAITALPVDERTSIDVSTDTMGGNVVNVVTVTSQGDLPFPLEIVIGGDEEVFFIGTPDYARAALSPDGGLLGDAQFQEASNYILADERSLLYLASAGLQPLVSMLEQSSGSDDAASFAALLSLVSSASMSASYEDGVSYGRAVWTFPE